MKKGQIVSLWVCVAYFVFVFLRVFARYSWGYLGLASEWADKTSIPKDHVFSILSAATDNFRDNAILVGIGVAMLTGIVVWITVDRNP